MSTALTPAAAALAGVLGLDAIPFHDPGIGPRATIEITCLADHPRRDELAALPPARRERLIEQAEIYGIDLDEPERTTGRITRPWRSEFFLSMTYEDWLEWEASKIPAGYIPIARAAVGVDPAWAVEDVARHLGVVPKTIHAYRARGQMPDPDGQVGRTPWWHASTIRAWRQ